MFTSVSLLKETWPFYIRNLNLVILAPDNEVLWNKSIVIVFTCLINMGKFLSTVLASRQGGCGGRSLHFWMQVVAGGFFVVSAPWSFRRQNLTVICGQTSLTLVLELLLNLPRGAMNLQSDSTFQGFCQWWTGTRYLELPSTPSSGTEWCSQLGSLCPTLSWHYKGKRIVWTRFWTPTGLPCTWWPEILSVWCLCLMLQSLLAALQQKWNVE